MKKIVGISILIFASIIFIVSAVSELTNSFFELRRKPSALKHWWGSDKGGTGDLYGFTCLPQFNVQDTSVLRKPDCSGAIKSYNIYALTDSYTEDIFKHPDYFCGAGKCGYAFSNNGDVLPVYLDRTKKNIVMIECVERNVRTSLADTSYLTRFITVSEKKINETKAAERAHNFHFHFNIKNLDGDYETNIWDYRFLRPLKQLKAKLTFNWFNRTYVDALVSPDGKYLLYQSTVDTSFLQSSYRPIGDTELKAIITTLNKVYDHYRRLGFDEVYLSIIPNPATILYPNYKGLKYNLLIPKLENDPSLKLKVFDIYQLFKNSPEKNKLYQHSDTHWTRFGSMVWLNEFNRKMALN
ncbi:MAG: hypothetical protein JWQ34_2190 [Mucilaginibacter sp.]|uniref:hypothetical protein n=1 Tax=Mucilaginibacter sp. TaxID=1882438 RepID=UPI0026366E22|nr:hypothetical protein [Mucilaginibacter sp.]MDB5003965.1 hypothetical protein [Mucilaginibacter sp.]